jgi:hypothetical protein
MVFAFAWSLGMSALESTKRIVPMFLKAVLDCDDLAMKLPVTEAEFETLADDFHERSTADCLYFGVIRALDGWLYTTNGSIECTRDYYSGHYQRFGLNIQALCDAHLRFIYIAVAAPGARNDIRALKKCTEFNRFIEGMPEKYFIIGDKAYGLSESLLIPFSGSQKHIPENDTYNFYFSQLRGSELNKLLAF